MIGINLSGAEFGSGNRYGYDYYYPAADEIAYYAVRGVELIRIPFTWERMQPTLGGALSSAELERMKTFLADAHAQNISVIIDLHNYGRYGGNTIGSSFVSYAQFADFWSKLAAELKGSPALVGYDLMNEPHDMGGVQHWPTAAQAAVDAIRQIDMNKAIYVEGDAWSTAQTWLSNNAGLNIKDPANNLYYEAHQYFDRWSSGTYQNSYSADGTYPDIGVDRLQPFVDWLKANNFKGFIGEFGVPNSDPQWLDVMDRFLHFMEANGLSGTAWGGGFWWNPNYPLRLGGGSAGDTPALALLQPYMDGAATGGTPPEPPVTDPYHLVVGTNYADLLHGTAVADSLDGRDGDDILMGSVGADLLNGGAGFDTASYAASTVSVDLDLSRASQSGGDADGDQLTGIEWLTGSAFADVLHGDSGANQLSGGGGDDLLVGRGGADLLDGGAGSDQASYAISPGAVDIDLQRSSQRGADAQGDVLVGIEWIVGSAFGDSLAGSAAAEQLSGGGGADILQGRGGADWLLGDDGFDTASYASSSAGVNVDLSRATQMRGDAAGDVLESIESVIGSAYKDQIAGDSGANLLLGGGNDDILNGRGGMDTLTGGAGRDRFVFDSSADANGDLITDRARGDTLDFRGIDANVDAFGDQAFKWLGTKAFTGVAGQLHYNVSGTSTVVEGDTNGDGVAEFAVTLLGVHSLGSIDFLL